MMEETRKWGVVALVSITILAVLFGVLAGVKAKKLKGLLLEERQKRVALEQTSRDLNKQITALKTQLGECNKTTKALLAENKRLKGELIRANSRIAKLEKDLKGLMVLKETLEENLKNTLMALPEDKRKEVISSGAEQPTKTGTKANGTSKEKSPSPAGK